MGREIGLGCIYDAVLWLLGKMLSSKSYVCSMVFFLAYALSRRSRSG